MLRPSEFATFYRIVRDGEVIDRMPIAAVQRILGENGVDMADLVDVTGHRAPGAAQPSCLG
jgi:hypothetical protein